ncbi:LysM peptidoglycan-binding domain-containing protein [Dysgonomonas sp. 25]|uniref:LysM peptidoglycan-binding domain-containing protein n=1 Tax=Dysgonomonas sp. 25 TaxID=2302933 RepID=UPI0013D4DE58|nr:LysM peptidoglycan-binding domain-containing protein [Dysgonomonas sp. 25]NDV67815.1 LysM peptidoglycan-binding domain-containing protein [Dysgonomonas sp. 25]
MKLVYKILILLSLLLPGASRIWAVPINADTVETPATDKYFTNEEQLKSFFQKLANLEEHRSGKINIVQIGDSHIQAGHISGAIRSSLQEVFGNGGLGFSFPYELVRTNGPRHVKYVSNVAWESWPNTRAIGNIEIGLGGFALSTNVKNFVLQLSTDTAQFTQIKILYPTEKPQYRLSVTAEPLKITSIVSAGGKTHKIRSGESLSTIARKYGVSVANLKKANGMKNNTIYAGRTLKIPSKNTVQVANVKMDENITYVETIDERYCSEYSCAEPVNRITVFPKDGHSKYTINGIVLENASPGIVYHSIGVNGAHMSDYRKYPLFFEQIGLLNPDLIIVSLGTNESFARMNCNEFMRQMDEFVSELKAYSQHATVLVTTPPPSMFRRSRVNTYVNEYATALTSQKNYPAWDLYNHMDGADGIKTGRFASMIGRDKIHYTQSGYELQGYMLATDFINAYNEYRGQLTK